mmetsp:Transcript_86550/g.269379  ORF Transcript_86550/g.269379 Transcript_86550/m.269379 type:complete len:288 (+) Transcript_86550:1234-2097(+)
MKRDVRGGADDLLLRLPGRVLLVLQVAYRPREVEVAVDAVLPGSRVLHVAAGRLNPLQLRGAVGLVVLAQSHRAACAAQDGAAVARVRHYELGVRDAAEAGGAAHEVRVHRPAARGHLPRRLRHPLVGQGLELRATRLPVEQELVHAVEGAPQRRCKVPGTPAGVQWELAELLGQVPLAELGDLFAAVAVHDPEKANAGPIAVTRQGRQADVRVLHAYAPALHAGCRPRKVQAAAGRCTTRVLLRDRPVQHLPHGSKERRASRQLQLRKGGAWWGASGGVVRGARAT